MLPSSTPKERLAEVTRQQLARTFRPPFFSMIDLTREALACMRSGACIINTTSVSAYRGSPHLVDYASTKGAIVAVTRSMALQLAEQGIRVNAVAPGPVWTPMIPSTFKPYEVAHFCAKVPMKRPGQPDEISPAHVYLASKDASCMTGAGAPSQWGEIING